MKTYTCPAWCAVDHGSAPLEDVFHRSGRIRVVPPADCSAPDEQAIVPQLTAHLVEYEVPTPGEAAAVINLELDDHPADRVAELDVAEADALLAQLADYTARLQKMRDQLAAITAG
ncbi:hypothetical protein [Streptomyces sp. NPDC047014]|uniref:DUF6907 domain-containing protein n=1 Tax=Streptomyces sp. NPDC047014 TaxID=3155736 RepID=UPI00340E8234